MSLIKSSNAILPASAQMPHHTEIAKVFEAFGGLQRQYNWLLTGDERFYAKGRPTWIGGDEFTRVVEETKPVYDWGVLSGFEPDIEIDLAADPMPYADGNRELWLPYPKPQHSQATVEIVCFDSSLTLLLSREPELTARFRSFFTDALDLDLYIDDHVGPILRTWEAAARAMPAGTVLTVPVMHAGQTTAAVEIAEGIQATVSVKQMRAAGFGPAHWFALNEYLKPGQRMKVRVVRMDAQEQVVVVEFLGMEA